MPVGSEIDGPRVARARPAREPLRGTARALAPRAKNVVWPGHGGHRTTEEKKRGPCPPETAAQNSSEKKVVTPRISGFPSVARLVGRFPQRPLREPWQEAVTMGFLGLLWTAVVGVFYVLGLTEPLDSWFADRWESWRPLPPSAPPVALVEINEIPTDRPWPWPRLEFAVVLRELARVRPKSVVVEPLLYQKEASFAAFDDTFRAVLGRFPHVALSGAALLSQEGGARPGPRLVSLRLLNPLPDRFPRYQSVWEPPVGLPEGSWVGISNLEPEAQGTVRGLPLVFRVGRSLHASLALVAAGIQLGADLSRCELDPVGQIVLLRDHEGRIVRKIPIDAEGRLRLRFSSWKRPLARVSYGSFLVGMNELVHGGAVPEELRELEGRQVWIGLTDPAVARYLQTPRGKASPVEIQLRGALQLMEGDFLVPTPRWALFGFLLLAVGAGARIFPYIPLFGALLVWIGIGLLPTLLSVVALRLEGKIFPVATYWIGIVGLLGAALASRVWGYHYVRARRR